MWSCVTGWSNEYVYTAGKYKDGRWVWYEGNKISLITKFFWVGGASVSPLYPCILAHNVRWRYDPACAGAYYFVCEW